MAKKNNDMFWKISTGVFAVLVIVLLVNVMSNKSSAPAATTTQTAQQAGSTIKMDFSQVIQSDTPVIGSANAPVTVLEFSDFSCPYCAAASGDNAQLAAYMQQQDSSWQPIVTNLMKDYVQTGKVRFALMYTYGHSGGNPAQLVAWCLNDQSSDLFWKFYPLAFANQNNVENLTAMQALAQGLGANMATLQTCLSSNKYQSRLTQEQTEAGQLGVTGTPAFFVGKTGGTTATLVEGAQPYSTFQQVIAAVSQ